MASNRLKAKGRREFGSFVRLPFAVMDSDDFRQMSRSALSVLMCLARQYTGKNNGDLSAEFQRVHKWGIGSKSTLAKALAELQRRNLIIQTRAGRFMNPGSSCSLYAITWFAIDECGGKLEVSATATPPRKFSLERAISRVQK